MATQQTTPEPSEVVKTAWETPELVKVDVSASTLAGINPGDDGGGALTGS